MALDHLAVVFCPLALGNLLLIAYWVWDSLLGLVYWLPGPPCPRLNWPPPSDRGITTVAWGASQPAEVICQFPWRQCPSGHLLRNFQTCPPGSIPPSLRHPLGQLRRSLMMFQYPCPCVQRHQCQLCTARTGAPSWHLFSSSILRSNDSTHCPAPLDDLTKMGTSFSWASPAMMMTSRRSLHLTSLQCFRRNTSGWGKMPCRTSPKASPRLPARSMRLLS